ncbi:MAG: hypothetical protein IGS38_21130, partial [Synechococcales cyanobacterium M58_A2018_015]|nr:hypothetical protein [Synechococcales cyanobacterium M58_A2018_015]
MPRSLKVRVDCLEVVRLAVQHAAFPSQRALAEDRGLALSTVSKFLTGKPVDYATFVDLCQRLSLEWQEIADLGELAATRPSRKQFEPTPTNRRIHWGEAVDVSVFFGRTKELTTLAQWIVDDRCRLITVSGIGGIGKTSLVATLVGHLQGEFEDLIWQSIRNAPPLEEVLATWIPILSGQQNTPLPTSFEAQMVQLMECLRAYRCLLVLDNFDTILSSSEAVTSLHRLPVGQYRDGYEGYGELLRRVATEHHRSCLVLTSREKPKMLTLLEGPSLPVRSLHLSGLGTPEAQAMLQTSGSLAASAAEWSQLTTLYDGNPLALKVVATTVQELFEGDVAQFLQQGAIAFGDINLLLDEQFRRLSLLEKQIMYWLAMNREGMSWMELQHDFVLKPLQSNLIDALQSLRRRSLVEKNAAEFTLQNVVMEYVTDYVIAQMSSELQNQALDLFHTHALIKATAKDYVRQSQTRLILRPILNGLVHAKAQLAEVLQLVRNQPQFASGYAAGNLLNLLCHLEAEVSHYDFSRLTIRQAYLKNQQLHHINFANAHFTNAVLTYNFGSILTVAFSPDGTLLATGGSHQTINLWRVTDGQFLASYQGHTDWVWSVAFSPDGTMLASGSDDHTVRLWNVRTHQCLQVLQGHTGQVWCVAFAPQGEMLASGADDHTVRLWNVKTGDCRQVLQGHTNGVWSLAFAPQDKMLVSGSADQTIRLWDVETGQCLQVLQGHTRWVRSVAFAPQGKIVASGSTDQTIRLWDVQTGECRQVLQGHTDQVLSVAFAPGYEASPDRGMIASGSDDQTVRLWDVKSQQCLHVLQGHTNRVGAVAFSPDGTMLVSGSEDQTVRLWDAKTRQCLHVFQGYTNRIGSVAFSP